MFLDMMKNIRERVTDVIFKARLAPPRQQAPAQRPPQQAPRPSAMPRPNQRSAGNIMGSSIVGPGFSVSSNPNPKKKNPEQPKSPENDTSE
jgi:hypothetical protein